MEKSAVLTDKLLEKLPETTKEILKIGNVAISASLPEPRNQKFLEQNEVAADATSNSSIAISKGTVKVNATLYVEYQIK